MGTSEDSGQRARATSAERRRALLSGAFAALVLFAPLAFGYALVQAKAWREIAAAGLSVDPSFYGAFPLHLPRLGLIALFAVDVGLWIALFLLLPIDDQPGRGAFLRARRRLRRRWLWAHAPLVPIAAIMAGARLHGEALTTSGAGATWFSARLASGGESAASAIWIRGETLLLSALAACFLVHIAMLCGPSFPRLWWRRLATSLAAAALLTALGWLVVVPLGDEGLFGAMKEADREAARACPGASELPISERIAVVHDSFVRTTRDGPALRGLAYRDLPLTVVALPELPLVGSTGLPLRLVHLGERPARRGVSLSEGHELRIDATGSGFVAPIPGACAPARVLKADRSLLALAVLERLALVEAGPLRVGLRARGGLAATPLPGGEGLEVLLAPPGAARPPELPAVRIAGEREGGEERAAASTRAEHPDALLGGLRTLPRVPAPDPEGRLVFLVTEQGLWEDVVRGLAASAAAGARQVILVEERDAAQSASRPGPERSAAEAMRSR